MNSGYYYLTLIKNKHENFYFCFKIQKSKENVKFTVKTSYIKMFRSKSCIQTLYFNINNYMNNGKIGKNVKNRRYPRSNTSLPRRRTTDLKMISGIVPDTGL